VQKNPSEKRTDVAKQLGLPPSTLNMITVKEKIREHSYMSVDQELTMCGMLCVWKKCVVSWEVEVVWRRCKVMVVVVVMMMKLSFMEALRVFDAHNITKRDQANIVNIEMLLSNLKWKGSTKQMKINDFLKKK
jgi:hypothetical protein